MYTLYIVSFVIITELETISFFPLSHYLKILNSSWGSLILWSNCCSAILSSNICQLRFSDLCSNCSSHFLRLNCDPPILSPNCGLPHFKPQLRLTHFKLQLRPPNFKLHFYITTLASPSDPINYITRVHPKSLQFRIPVLKSYSIVPFFFFFRIVQNI